MSCLYALPLMLLVAADAPPQINPVPRPVLSQPIAQWQFDRDTEGWVAQRHCTLRAEGGSLVIEADGSDAHFHRPVDLPGGHLQLELRARSSASGGGAVYWVTDQSPHPGEDKVKHFPLRQGDKWHQYSVAFDAPGRLKDLRLDPGDSAGKTEIDWIRLVRLTPQPLVIERVDVVDGKVRFSVKNDQTEPCQASAAGQAHTFPPGAVVPIELPDPRQKAVEPVTLELTTPGFAPLRRTVFLLHPELERDWIVCPMEGLVLKVARDGSMACVWRGDQLVAALGPLVHCDGRVPALRLAQPGPAPRLEGEGVSLALSAAGHEITVALRSQQPCEGPVVRAQGRLQQGLLAGLEYLGQGEPSSSTLDIETEEHLRFAPDPLKVTWPLMSLVTDRGSVSMTWDDMSLGPVFATPNFFDAAPDHRMALRGTKLDAVIHVDRLPLEETILWAVQRRGLPPV